MNSYTIEFFEDEYGFHAYIGEESGSGYDCCGKTREEVMEQVKQYLLDWAEFPEEYED